MPRSRMRQQTRWPDELPLERRRVLVAGVPVDAPAMHAAIEAEGAVVVAELSPFGGCGTSADVEIADDPFAALANHYGRESIDARLPVNVLMRKLDDLLGAAQAVVLSQPQDDASFGWDYPRVRELLARHSIPHTVLSGDPAFGATAADRERIRSLLGSAPTRPGGPRVAEKQLQSTLAAAAFQKQWFGDLRRRVFDERQPYALIQADVPFELFDLLEIPAVSNQWWSSLVAAKRQAPAFLAAMDGRRNSRPALPLLQPRARDDPLLQSRRSTVGRAARAAPAVCTFDVRLHSPRLLALGRGIRRGALRDRASRLPASCRRAGGS